MKKPTRLFYHHQVEVENPDLVTFPDFSKASYQECVLRPRDVLFIPQKHWHYVRSLELSFSVSFWWSWFLRNKTACVVKSCIAFICTNAKFLRFRLLYAYINVSLTVNNGVIIQYCHELDEHLILLQFKCKYTLFLKGNIILHFTLFLILKSFNLLKLWNWFKKMLHVLH